MSVKKIIVLMVLCIYQITFGKQTIPKGVNAVEFLRTVGLIGSGSVRVHLGCGESYLRGYINIDFPSSEHTVQSKSVADVYADITMLAFPPQSLDEIRLHHLFEHFNRQTALSLLCSWHQALKVGGLLYIETPDFLTSINMIVNGNYTHKEKQCIIRHIFGSHEAYWAYHYDGWYEEKYKVVLSALGYEISSIERNSHLLTHNIVVKARKTVHRDSESLAVSAKQLLRDYMVDESVCEKKMHGIWCNDFDK